MSNISRLLPWLILLGCLVLAGCGGVSGVTDKVTGMFDGKDDEDDNKPLPPAELIEFEPTVEVEKVWSGRYGKGVEKLYLKLVPAPYYDRILVADRDGRMIAISKEDGSKLWQERTKKIHISGGVGAGEGLALVGTSDGLVIARSAKTGEEIWTAQVSSEVLAAPQAGGGLVVVRSADGKLFGLEASTGERRWIYDRTVPRLTLRGNSPPTIYDDMVFAGFDNGRLAGLELETGRPIWEAPLSIPSGRSDLERMVDVDSAPVLLDNRIFVAGFQGRVAAAESLKGQLEWTRDISSYAGLAVDDQNVYVTDEESNVWALDRDTGASEWKQEGLVRRQVTKPVVVGDYVVVGDFKGYTHWMDRRNGDFVNRIRVDNKPIIAPPISMGDAVLLDSVEGVLTVLRPK